MADETNDNKTMEKPWLFKEGNPGGPGRTKGVRDFSSDFDDVVKEVAEEEGITISEARKALLKVAYRQGKKGNFNFYKDLTDRYYGKEPDKHEVKFKPFDELPQDNSIQEDKKP